MKIRKQKTEGGQRPHYDQTHAPGPWDKARIAACNSAEKGGGRGSGPSSGSRKYAQGGQGGGAGKQHQVRAGRMALRVGFEQGFPGFRSVLVSAHIPT